MSGGVVRPRSADWTATGVSAANTAQTITKAAADGANRHFLTHVSASFGAAAETATGVLIQLERNDVVIMSWYHADTAPLVVDFTHPIEGSAGDTFQLVIAAGGTSVVSIGNMAGYTV